MTDWQTLLSTLLPSILQFIEVVYPHRVGNLGTGATKMGAAVNIAQNVLTVAAAAGAIPNEDAQNVTAIADHIQTEVLTQKMQGRLGGLSTPGVPTDHTTLIKGASPFVSQKQANKGKFVAAPKAVDTSGIQGGIFLDPGANVGLVGNKAMTPPPQAVLNPPSTLSGAPIDLSRVMGQKS